jgi:predicted acyl esterase
MIPMRDGVKLFTVVPSPTDYHKPVPILMERTPYGADIPLKEDSTISVEKIRDYYRNLLKEG